MISLAIANYNRAEMTIESFIQVINNDLVAEIIILDDYSDIEIYRKLQNLINNLNTNKVKLYRNEKNLGSFLNKYETVKRCSSDWVILLDCDNIIENNYIEIISKLNKEEDMLYCPEVLYKLDKKGINWTYKKFNHLIINKKNAKTYLDNSPFGVWLNTGNYFFNKQKYITTIEQTKKDDRLSLLDSFYFNYLWLANGYRMRIVPDLYYIHRVHADSYYLKNKEKFADIHQEIKENIKKI